MHHTTSSVSQPPQDTGIDRVGKLHDLTLAKVTASEVSPTVALWTSPPEQLGKRLAGALSTSDNHVIKLYRSDLEGRWQEVLTGLERASRAQNSLPVGVEFSGKLLHEYRQNPKEFYRSICELLIRRFENTPYADTGSFREFVATVKDDFSALYASEEEQIERQWDGKPAAKLVEYENFGANLWRLYEALGLQNKATPFLVIHFGDLPVYARGAIEPLSSDEESKQSDFSDPASKDLQRRLSAAVSLIQELMLGSRGTGCHYALIVPGWLLDVLRTGFEENQRWVRSIFREGVIREELSYHTVVEVE